MSLIIYIRAHRLRMLFIRGPLRNPLRHLRLDRGGKEIIFSVRLASEARRVVREVQHDDPVHARVVVPEHGVEGIPGLDLDLILDFTG